MIVALILKSPNLTDEITEEKVIYADAAYKFAGNLKGKTVLGVVGDFDSLGRIPKNEKIVLLNEEKNFTDGERAVLFAKECGATDIVIYGAYGGRIEHILGNIALLKIAQNIGIKAVIKSGKQITELIGVGEHRFRVKRNSKVSLIPYGGHCTFETSQGLYYPLDNLTLTPMDTRGISNVAVNGEISFTFISGEALIIREQAE